jgi:hypothetical protein
VIRDPFPPARKVLLCVSFGLRSENSRPNQWLVVLESGRLVRAGVGLACFRQIGQSVVRMPARLQRVAFSAQQVTHDMAGVEVRGFALWTVDGAGDGPFRAYRCLDGMSDAGILKASHNLGARHRCARSVARAARSRAALNAAHAGAHQLDASPRDPPRIRSRPPPCTDCSALRLLPTSPLG